MSARPSTSDSPTRRSRQAVPLVPAVETLAFVLAGLPRRRSRILEVGCGSGELATLLVDHGHEVVAIDASDEAVAQARLLGVDARQACWPDPVAGRFDAVLFTRSLHHIAPLDDALSAAGAALASGGRLIVEDFAYEAVDDSTDRWFRRALQRLTEEADCKAEADSFAARLLSAEHGLEAWQEDHDHDLHSSQTMREALTRQFQLEHEGETAYLYRYAVDLLDNDRSAYVGLRNLLTREVAAIADRRIVPIGRRTVASCR